MDNPHKPSPPEEKAVKRWMPLALTLCAGAVFAQTQKPATPAEDMNAFAAVQTAHSCEEADKIKFSKDAYLALDPTERVFLDATWQSCQTPKDSEEQPTIIVNPTPTGDNDRVFYGLVKRKQLRERRRPVRRPAYGGATMPWLAPLPVCRALARLVRPCSSTPMSRAVPLPQKSRKATCWPRSGPVCWCSMPY